MLLIVYFTLRLGKLKLSAWFLDDKSSICLKFCNSLCFKLLLIILYMYDRSLVMQLDLWLEAFAHQDTC